MARSGKEAEKILVRLRALGAGTALDDFGTDYCPHGYLKYCLIDYLKSDRCFVRGTPMMSMMSTSLKAIIAMACSLNIGLSPRV